jgi:hypothetical protein
MRAKKVDSNHKQIIKTLREIGASVFDTSAVGRGFPDIVVGWQGVNYLVEIKTPKGKPTEQQISFFTLWRGQAVLVRSATDILQLLGVDPQNATKA